MLVSVKWLRDYVDVDVTPAEMAERLTMAGLEVDALEERRPAFSGVKVARILSLKPHPDADHLSLCDVTAGESTYPVVCGAANIRVGDCVPLALAGATLPGGLVVRTSRIRGERSDGMLASEEELGIGTDASGIMILPADLSPGAELAELDELRDTVLDIGVTPNRADCLSITGVAREWAAIAGGALRIPAALPAESGEDIRELTSVTILDPDLCPRYTARIIKGVRIGPSPLWIRQRLEAVGLRPINNVVDVTNFVMMELGQPLHAFDYRFLEEGRIVVRRSRAGEPFVSLDGRERILNEGTLLICDGVKPVAIGGIMGGLNSEIQTDTETILLESAYFNPASIRRTSREMAMGTDAAFRFERGIDPEGVIPALNRAADLIARIAGGTVCRGLIDAYPQKIETAGRIPLRIRRVNDILGTSISGEEILRILGSLQMAVEPVGEDCFAVTPPTCRVDIVREIDLIEEVARLSGYDRIPATLPAVSATTGIRQGRAVLEGKLRDIMTGAGYSEAINYSFISPSAVDRLGIDQTDQRRRHVEIRNPLTEEQAVMRTTMVYSLLLNAGKNADCGRFDLKIFELGRTFIGRGAGELPLEENRLACMLAGLRYEDRWHSGDLRADFYDLKGCIENMLDACCIPMPSFRSGMHEPFLHPGKSCGVYSGEDRIGSLGEVHPDVLARMDLKGPIVVCELDLDRMAALSARKISFRSIPRFPSSSRDVAFLVRTDQEAREILLPAGDPPEELLEKVQIFDIYEGKNLPAGTKSLGLRFSYRSADRTLTDDEVNEVHGRIVKRIVGATGAAIR
ncbi:MAG: phenylalanine--tRNA ligase subunit beta [Thermodesulfobacteriota bacterium]